MQQTYTLPERIDTKAAPELASALRAQPIEDLTIDASLVTTVGALGLQVLVAANKEWQANEKSIFVSNPSKEFYETCDLIGLPMEAIGIVKTEQKD